MNKELRKYFGSITFILIPLWFISCSGKPGTVKTETSTSPVVNTAPAENDRLFSFISPSEDDGITLHTAVKIGLQQVKNTASPDSLRFYYDGNYISTVKNSPWSCTIAASNVVKTGRKALKAVAFRSGNQVQTLTRFIVVFSDVAPKRNGYRVIRSYPHDREAFTQGLVYENGYLFEGTGQENHSYLRKEKLETGQVINQLDLDSQFFGEGIAIYGDLIYQLTWQSQVGFVYDKSTFRLLNKVRYETEGWGITTMGKLLVMSDGTNTLYFRDPETFSVVSTIEVYDNKARVMKLNELEFINGEIWANIWQTDLIARIDPASGKVIAYIDMARILKDSSTDTTVDVLNGIAWDKSGNRIFVTGKNWPLLFEIKLIE